ncbi:MAG: zinc ribbon domain-containing protein, partial [Mycobacteriaceae bacterium]|nr:zinc ribbon domain-containing protein [Mycobacteriaceae bacterium]
MSSVVCPVCETEVPAGAFCGLCGSRLTAQRGDGPAWLRLRAYSAAPGEHVLRPSPASSLFPHLHHRAPFRLALIILLSALVTFAVLRWQAPLVAVSALGLPLLFYLYLRETDAHRDLPVRAALPVALLSACLGVGWAWLVTAVTWATGTELIQPGWESVAISVGGALMMVVPVVLAKRLVGPGHRESLDGFVIGVVAAMSFTAAATLARLAPQFSTGLVASDRPIAGLVVEAGIRGDGVALTAAAAGGMVGAALWFTRPDPANPRGGQWLAGPLPAFALVLAAYAVLGLTDVSALPQAWQLAIYLTVALVMIVGLRIVLHVALLREAHDPATQEPATQ